MRANLDSAPLYSLDSDELAHITLGLELNFGVMLIKEHDAYRLEDMSGEMQSINYHRTVSEAWDAAKKMMEDLEGA